jgi:hypothetical protein
LTTEVAVIHPVPRFRLTNDTPLPATGDTLTVPSASLSWTAAPWFDLAYRLPRSLGFLSINYRFLTTEGSDIAPFGRGIGDLHSRLDLNLINLDYGTTPYAFAPRWDFQWRAGVQLADVWFDSTLRGDGLFQQASNSFRGAGPHVRMDLQRHLECAPGLSLFGRLEGAGVLGRISQKFHEQIGDTAGFWEQNGIQFVPVLWVQAGCSYVPATNPHWEISLGYVYEHWWFVGQLGTDSNAGVQSATRGEFDTQGVFLRCQVDF